MRSIGARLIAGYVVVVTITLVVALLVGRLLLDRNLLRGIDLLNAAEFQEILDRTEEAASAGSERTLLRQIKAHAELDDALYYFQVRDPSGKIIFRSANLKKATFPPNPEGIQNQTMTLDRLGPVRVSQFEHGPYRTQIGTSLANREQLFKSFSKIALILVGIALVLSFFFGYGLSRVALDPIRRIQQTASRITADNLSERIPVGKAKDEVSDLTRLLNQMFDRLEYSFGRLWRFAADASHELKTPLALIRLQSEKLLLHGNLAPKQMEAVQQQMDSINRLHSVIEKLLFISKSEFGAVRLNLKSQSTRELISAFSEDAQVLCEDAGVRFEVVENPEFELTFDSALLRQVLLNLLNNALQVLGPGGVITLASSRKNSHWHLSVSDNGPGLPEDKLQEIFEPFFRMDRDGLSRAGAGAGLGLAICRSIIDLHRGKIYASNRSEGTGLCVTVQLPCSGGL